MFGWFTAIRLAWGGLPGPLKKVLVYVAIGLAALYAFRMYTNRLYSKAKAEVRQEITKDLVEKHESEMLDIRKQIASEKQANEMQELKMRNEFLERFADQEKRFSTITISLQSSIGAIDKRRIQADEALSRISDSDLDGYIRILSRQLTINAAGKAGNSQTVK